MTIEHYNHLYCQSLDFLTNAVENSSTCIIITHHLPSYQLIHSTYLNNPMNQWFASIMLKYNDKVKGWFYGHTHFPLDIVLHGIPTFCNPVGYKQERDKVEYNKMCSIVF